MNARRAAWRIGAALLVAGCPIQPDCPDTFRGVRHGEELETTLERVDETATASQRRGLPGCDGELEDVGSVLRWRVRLDGPGDGCGARVKVDPPVAAATLVPSRARLPSGCTGTWTFEVLLRPQGSILDPVPPGAEPHWLMWREFLETSAPASCGLPGGARRCGDFFIAPTKRPP